MLFRRLSPSSIGRGRLAFVLAATLYGVVCVGFMGTSEAAQVRPSQDAPAVVVSAATVTAGIRGGDSAVVLTFFNGTQSAVSCSGALESCQI